MAALQNPTLPEPFGWTETKVEQAGAALGFSAVKPAANVHASAPAAGPIVGGGRVGWGAEEHAAGGAASTTRPDGGQGRRGVGNCGPSVRREHEGPRKAIFLVKRFI